MPTLNDGAIPFGTRVLTLKRDVEGDGSYATLATYVAEALDLTQPSQFTGRYNEVNAPLGGVQTDDFVTGTATIQLASAGTPIPTPGDHFQEAIRSATVETWYLSDVGQPEEKGADRKVRISFRKRVVITGLTFP